eukprot:Gb_25510 [translate_table: standard]
MGASRALDWHSASCIRPINKGASVFQYPVSYFGTSADIVKDRPILVREFIHSALYDPQFGYFAKRSGAVGLLEKAIQFNQLEGTQFVSGPSQSPELCAFFKTGNAVTNKSSTPDSIDDSIKVGFSNQIKR